MANKEIKTRIALKYDTLANWNNENLGDGKGAKLKLLPGEIGLCEIPTGNTAATTAPTVLFKVGSYKNANTKELYTFAELPWASALAADVYSWAKTSTAEGVQITFQEAGKTTDSSKSLGTWLKEVQDRSNDNNTRIGVLEAAMGLESGSTSGTDSIAGRLTTAEEAIAKLNGAATADGSLAKAVADAKAYTDSLKGTSGDQYGADTVYGAKAYAYKQAQDVVGTTSDTKDSNTVYGAKKYADQVKTDIIGGDTDATQGKTIAGAKAFATAAVNTAVTNLKGTKASGDTTAETIAGAKVYADNKVAGLADGQVKTNKEAIATLVGSDTGKSVRAIAAEETAKIVDGADANYDTLKEIAQFIMNDQTGAAAMANDITSLKRVVNGYTGDKAIQTAISNAQTNAVNTAAGDATAKASAAQAAAEATAKTYTDARETAITTAYKAYADQAEADAKTYADTKKTEAISAAANDATTKANAAQTNAETNIKAIIGGSYTSAATVATDIADVKANYVRVENDMFYAGTGEDMIIFNCGTASTVI